MMARAPVGAGRRGGRAFIAAVATDRPRAAARLCAAWIAIVALYVQIVAVAACGSPIARGETPGGPVICHAEASDQAGSLDPAGGHAPADHPSCPFCAVSCHALAVPPPVLAHVVPRTAFWVAAPQVRAVARVPSATFAVGAPPRGPPARA